MTKYAINSGSATHLEEQQTFTTYASAVSVFTRRKHLGIDEAAELVKLHYNDAGYCCRLELKKSFGLPVSGKTKIRCPEPELKVLVEEGVYGWRLEHDTLGFLIYENSQAKCVEAFWKAVETESTEIGCIKYRDEWYY